MSNLIENSEKVLCPICNKEFKQITLKHLKKHSLTVSQFKEQYPSCYTINPEVEERIKLARLEGKKRKEKTTVEKPCWNFECCGNKVFVNINVGNKNTTCEECRSKNLFHPSVIKNKQRLSEQAKRLNSDETIIEKRTETLRNRSQEEIDSWRNKREKTLIEKDGEEWKVIQHEKTKAGMLKTHGREHALQVPEILEQAQTTHFLNTGVINPMHNPDNVKKVFEQRDQKEITKTTIQTNIEKYGGPSPMCNQEIIDKSNRTRLKQFLPRFYIFLEKIGLELLDEYDDCYTYNKYKCLKCGNIFDSNWNQLQQGRVCSSCSNKFKPSKGENEIYDFLTSIGINNILRNNRSLISPYEIDLVLPDYKLAIEYCGLYTHREDVLKRTRKARKKINDFRYYHIYKHNECLKNGYRLLTIFEDEWLFKEDIVKAMLKQRLGLNTGQIIGGRECNIHEITFETKRDFLNQYHVQGNDNSNVFLGAFTKETDELIAVMTFSPPSAVKGQRKKKKGHWELNRFCTNNNYRLPGVANKLLKHFQRNFEWSCIYSYADRRWSSGDLYFKLKFDLVNEPEKINPGYWYVDSNRLKRMHRSRFGRSEKNDFEGMTEQMYWVSQGYNLIYDCGNLKFELTR
jgi:DNA-directed RNA polymerase subunit RPC12/RpoP